MDALLQQQNKRLQAHLNEAHTVCPSCQTFHKDLVCPNCADLKPVEKARLPEELPLNNWMVVDAGRLSNKITAMLLKRRLYKCPYCGVPHNRDTNCPNCGAPRSGILPPASMQRVQSTIAK